MAEIRMNPQFLGDVQARSKRALVAAGQAYLRAMAGTLSNSPPRHGREYRVGKSARVHVASAPGEPPALLTGDLRRRAGYRLASDAGDVVMVFGSSVPYARRLELGGGAIEPRPAWGMTLTATFPTLMEVYAKAFGSGAMG